MADDDKPTSKDAFNRITNPDGTPVRDKDNAAPTHKPTYARSAPNLAPPGMSGIRQRPIDRLVPQQETQAKDKDMPSEQREKIQFRKDDDQDQRIDFRANKNNLVPNKPEADLSIDGGKSDSSQWISGKIITMPGYSFHAKVFDEPSEYGIDNGTISKLQITKNGEQVASFDRGWDQKPESAEHKEALNRIRNSLDDTPDKAITAPDRSKDKDHGIDR